MGWLGKARKAIVEGMSVDPHDERKAAAWKQWASEHGWTYQAEAPELVGRYRPDYSPGSEWYLHVLVTELHGIRTMAFEHHTYHREPLSSEDESTLRVGSFIVLQLPGLPPPEFVRMGAATAIRKLGGGAPGGFDLDLVGSELVAQRAAHQLDPAALQAQADVLAWQISEVPPTFWRPLSGG